MYLITLNFKPFLSTFPLAHTLAPTLPIPSARPLHYSICLPPLPLSSLENCMQGRRRTSVVGRKVKGALSWISEDFRTKAIHRLWST
jgi:hypothetical protein